MMSSDRDRNIQSASSLLAGLYQPNDEITSCESIPWKDIPVHSIPSKVDNIIRVTAPCPLYDRLMNQVYSSSVWTDLLDANKEIISFVNKNINVSDSDKFAWYQVWDVLTIQVSTIRFLSKYNVLQCFLFLALFQLYSG
jgi:hypothetical protein